MKDPHAQEWWICPSCEKEILSTHEDMNDGKCDECNEPFLSGYGCWNAKQDADAALAAWRAAWGELGPQTPDEVPVFLREHDRVNGQVAALQVGKARAELEDARAELRETYDRLEGEIMRHTSTRAECEGLRSKNVELAGRVAELEAEVARLRELAKTNEERWLGAAAECTAERAAHEQTRARNWDSEQRASVARAALEAEHNARLAAEARVAELEKDCEAVIRWRASLESGEPPPAG